MKEIFQKNRYLPMNVALLILAGLYSFQIKSNFLKRIYFLWRICGLIICTLFIVWITAGLIESGSFVLDESAPAILHLCKRIRLIENIRFTFIQYFSCVYHNLVFNCVFLYQTWSSWENVEIYGKWIFIFIWRRNISS